MTVPGVPTLPYSTWNASSGSTRVAYRNSDASRTAVAGLERAVVDAAAQLVEEAARRRLELLAEPVEHDPARRARRGDHGLDRRPGFAQRPGRRVDRERGLVAEQVAGHRGEHEAERGVHRRDLDRVERGAEAVVALVDDRDRGRLVRPVDRELLGDVVGVRAGEPGAAHEDERLGREVDVLLVLGAVAGDRLVAELRELDPHLVRGDAVRAVADDGPVAAARARAAARSTPIDARRASTCSIAVGRSRSAWSIVTRSSDCPSGELVGEREREQEAGRDLRVERLRRRDAHLHVAPVGRVEHAVGCGRRDRCCGGSRSRAPSRHEPGRGRRCGWCRWSCRSG